jgi:endonuclease III
MPPRRSRRQKVVTPGETPGLKEDIESPKPDGVISSTVLFDGGTPNPKRVKLEPGVEEKKRNHPSVRKGANVHPSPEEARFVTEALGRLHPEVLQDTDKRRMEACGKQVTVLDGVVSTMLSQNTTAKNSTRAFAGLKQAFPTWDKVAKCKDIKRLEDSIRVAGLSQIRANRIQRLCQTLVEERGSASLEYLRDMSNDEIKQELSRFKGLGKKTISCVLLFTLGRGEFPVDTHVHRITKQIKWIPPSFSRDDAYDHLNQVLPDDIKLDLHCLLIEHGRQCHRCAARGKPQFPPKDGSKLNCPLVNVSTFSGVKKEVLVKVEVAIKPEIVKS